MAHLQVTTKVTMQTLNRGDSDNRCLQAGLWGPHEEPVLLRQVACKEGQEYPHQHPGTGNNVDGLSKV